MTAGTGVTVNSILPGPTRSDGAEGFLAEMAKRNNRSIDQMAAEFVKEHRPSSLLQRFATVEEVANLVVYVASPLSSATNAARRCAWTAASCAPSCDRRRTEASARRISRPGHRCYAPAMIALPKHKMTADEFLAWAEAQPKEAGVFELHDGEVVMRHGPLTSQQAERARHWKTKFEIAVAFQRAIERAGLPCFAAVDGPTVRVASGKTYRPDALVYCGKELTGDELEVLEPVILAEVLSPGTESVDYGDKLEAYFTLPSLHHYLVIDPARPAMVHYQRAAGGGVAILIVKSPALRLDPPGLEVELGEVLGREESGGEA